MIIGRLGIHSPTWPTYFGKGGCGCLFAWTPLVSLTWHGKECKCGKCDQYVCVCPPICDVCDDFRPFQRCEPCFMDLCVFCAQLHECDEDEDEDEEA